MRILDYFALIAHVYCRYDDDRSAYTTHSNMATDGHVLSDNHSNATFMARAMLQIAAYTVRQMDPDIGMRIDTTKFLSAFSFLSEAAAGEDDRTEVGPWPLGPGYQSDPPSISRQEAYQLWEDHKFKAAEFLPNYAKAYQPEASDAIGRREHHCNMFARIGLTQT